MRPSINPPQLVAATRWKGDWDIGTAYIVHDAVHHEGSAYLCVANDTGTEPDPEVDTPWDILASGGEAGAGGVDPDEVSVAAAADKIVRADALGKITDDWLSEKVARSVNSTRNVLNYGAVGDGVTDDTAAIQAALDANTFGVVVLPHTYAAGENQTRYMVSESLVLELTYLLGEFSTAAVNGVTIKPLAGFEDIALIKSWTWDWIGPGPTFFTEWLHWAQIKNLGFDCDGIAEHGVAIHQMGEESLLDNVHVHNAVVSGYLLTGTHAPATLFRCSAWLCPVGLELTFHPGNEIVDAGNGGAGGVVRLIGFSGDGVAGGGGVAAGTHIYSNGSHKVNVDGLKSEGWDIGIHIEGDAHSGSASQWSINGGYLNAVNATSAFLVQGTARPIINADAFGISGYENVIIDDVRSETRPMAGLDQLLNDFKWNGTVYWNTAEMVIRGTLKFERFNVDRTFTPVLALNTGDEVVLKNVTGTDMLRLGDGNTFGGYGVTPVARPSATADIKEALVSEGWLQGTSATPLDLDGGTLTAAEAVVNGRSVDNKLAEWFNVKDFGAVGDGVADDTGAIQDAIDAASLVHGTVFIPAGQYKITATLIARPHVRITGSGAGDVFSHLSRLLPFGGDFDAIQTVGSADMDTDLSYAHGAVIENLTIQAGVLGSAGTTGSGIRYHGGENSALRNLSISGFPEGGIREVKNSAPGTIENVVVRENKWGYWYDGTTSAGSPYSGAHHRIVRLSSEGCEAAVFVDGVNTNPNDGMHGFVLHLIDFKSECITTDDNNPAFIQVNNLNTGVIFLDSPTAQDSAPGGPVAGKSLVKLTQSGGGGGGSVVLIGPASLIGIENLVDDTVTSTVIPTAHVTAEWPNYRKTGLLIHGSETVLDSLEVSGVLTKDGVNVVTEDDLEATAVSFTPAGTIAATTVQAAIEEVASEAGGGGGSDDQTAAEVPFTPTGNLAADDVQEALVELDTEKAATGHNHDGAYDALGAAAAVDADLDTHVADATAAHAGTAISFTPAGDIAATNVQAAIEEVAAEAGGSLPNTPAANIPKLAGSTNNLDQSNKIDGILQILIDTGIMSAP